MTKTVKRIICLVLSLVLTVSLLGMGVSADETSDLEAFFESLLNESEPETEEAEDEKPLPTSAEEALSFVKKSDALTVENKSVSLTVDKSSGYIYITDKSSGKLWTSNPYDAEADTLATGVTRTNLRSQIIVKYIKDNNISSVNNYAGSTNNGGAAYTATADTIRADYTFPNEEITIPVEYKLTGNGFTASVLFGEIKDTQKCRVNQIEVLPYFGAAGLGEQGYMFIPDGAGALVELNNGKQEGFPYKKEFYGGDRGIIKSTETAIEKNLLLPVYGMKVGNHAFIATVEQGAELASLYACVSGKQSNYNRIYTYATYRAYDTVNLSDAIGQNVYAKYTALDAVKLPTYTVSYTLLSGGKANYVGMAEVVRENLFGDAESTDSGETQLFVDFYGATQKEKAFLGIRYTGVQTLTTFSEAQSILEKLKAEGVGSITAGYRNFSASDYKNKLAAKVVPDGKLGGKKAYKKLLSYAKDNNVKVYPYADFVTFRENGNSYWSLTDVIMGLELSVIKQYEYSINDGMPDKGGKPWYLVAGDRYGDAKKQLLKSIKKYGSTGVLLDESVNYIYNDFSPNGYQADRTVTAMQEVYDAAASISELLLSAPNAYALKYATALTDIPMCSSQYVMFDGDVPFLQIVLKGQLPFSSEALNIEGLSDTTLLSLIETGSNPKFALIHEEGKYLIGTELDKLYGATYSECEGDVVDYYNALSDVAKKVKGATITAHERKGDMVTVTYANGVKIYLNYGKTAQNAEDGKTVDPFGYRVIG